MDYNYHTHTYRCHHATGTPENYIKNAIEDGIKRMGFSDHVPFMTKDGYCSKYRVAIEEADAYIEELRALREKYKNEIDIKIGFEMDYFEGSFRDTLSKVIGYGAEYVILGQHFLNEDRPGEKHTMKETDSVERLEKYVSIIVDAIKSGVFTYIAHPDVINFVGDGEIYEREMRKICVASREYNIPLEINFLGIRENRSYPHENFWAIAGQEKCPVTFGFDAHDEKNACDRYSLDKAMEWVGKYNLNYIGCPHIIDIRNMQQK